MFEVVEQMLIQTISLIPYILGIYLIFDLIGNLFFTKGK